jgi:hypothetical protein
MRPLVPSFTSPLVLPTVALGLLAGACTLSDRMSRSESTSVRAPTRDSAGVQIVEYGGSLMDLPSAFRIVESPLLDLGGPRGDPDHELTPSHPFHHAARLSDGRWVVPDRSSLKVFDAEGRFLSAIGRRGDGPGEFRQPRRVCIAPGDSIVAIDQNGSRVTVFSSDGALVRMFTVRDGYPEASGCLGDGSVLTSVDVRPDPADSVYRVATLRSASLTGSDRGAVATIPLGAPSIVVQMQGHAVPDGDLVYTGDGRLPEVRVYHRDGRLERIVRWADTPVAVTDEVFAQVVRAVLPTGNFEENLARQRVRRHPSTFPVYQQILLDDAGRMWVQDAPDVLNPQSWKPSLPWTVFDASGRPLGRLRAPALSDGFVDISGVAEDGVWLRWKDDELGFVHLTFHPLERISESP